MPITPAVRVNVGGVTEISSYFDPLEISKDSLEVEVTAPIIINGVERKITYTGTKEGAEYLKQGRINWNRVQALAHQTIEHMCDMEHYEFVNCYQWNYHVFSMDGRLFVYFPATYPQIRNRYTHETLYYFSVALLIPVAILE